MITIEVRGTKVTSTKNVTQAGAKATFQIWLMDTYNCNDEISVAWTIDDENHTKYGVTTEHFNQAKQLFNNLPKEIVL